MFIGHYALAFAAKRAAPRTSLGAMVFACQWLDLLWPVLTIAGIERFRVVPGITRVTPLDFEYYPWSHSLLMAALWAALISLLYFAGTRYRTGALALAALVISHWFLDWLTHRPDMPLSPWMEAKAGLGIWNSLPLTIAIEGMLFAFGFGLYLKTTRALDRKGSLGLWVFAGFLVVVWLANFTPTPALSVNAISYSALLLWLTPLWAWWIDRRREARK